MPAAFPGLLYLTFLVLMLGNNNLKRGSCLLPCSLCVLAYARFVIAFVEGDALDTTVDTYLRPKTAITSYLPTYLSTYLPTYLPRYQPTPTAHFHCRRRTPNCYLLPVTYCCT
jgi:hypothetical protein